MPTDYVCKSMAIVLFWIISRSLLDEKSHPSSPQARQRFYSITYTIIIISVVFDKIEKTIDKKLFRDYNRP